MNTKLRSPHRVVGGKDMIAEIIVTLFNISANKAVPIYKFTSIKTPDKQVTTNKNIS